MRRITERDVEAAAADLKAARIAAGRKTWLSVEYYNGWCHLHEVDADTERRHCCPRRHRKGGAIMRVIYQNHAVKCGSGCYEMPVGELPHNPSARREVMERLACRILLGREGRDWRILQDDQSPANMRAETYCGTYSLIVRGAS